jgi:hypothetical protein
MSSNTFFYDWFATAKEPVMRRITRAIDLKTNFSYYYRNEGISSVKIEKKV